MKTPPSLLVSAVVVGLAFLSTSCNAADPWTPQQLMKPADLATVIKNPKAKQPIIFCIGPDIVIPNSIDIGPTKDANNVAALKKQLSKLPKNTDIVIYCGCCPYSRCPNVRPAFDLLNEMKFTNHKLLDLPKNIKTDWIDHGYPVIE